MTKIYKLVSIFILISMFFSYAPVVFADDSENLIIGGDFEDEDDALKYSGGYIDQGAAYEGKNGIQISNPYGMLGDEIANHLLEYNETISLEEGVFYTLSGYVLNPLAERDTQPNAVASLDNGGDTLFINIESIGNEWSFFSVSFMAMRTQEYSLAMLFEKGDMYVGFFMDSLSLTVSAKTPSYATFEGAGEVRIPDVGRYDYRYNVVVYDDNDERINVLLRDLEITAEDIPEGIEFDETTGILSVYPNASTNAEFSLVCNASVGMPLREGRIDIVTKTNLFLDASFDEGVDYWYSSGNISYEDGYAALFAETDSLYGKCAAMSYSEQLTLTEGRLYVFRAKVKSDEEFSASSVHILNTSFAQNGYAEINIADIGGGEWSDVVSGFYVESTGIYELTINLCASSERPIYIDDVFLGVEDSAPTTLSLHAPGNIMRPTESLTLPCYATIYDQSGSVMDGYDADMSISPMNKGVYLKNGEIIVTNEAKIGEYSVTASYGEMQMELAVCVGIDAVGDGGFEQREANEWWTASDGAMFSIVDYGDNRWGYVHSPDSTCLVINNSYMELAKGQYYVFSASAGSGRECTATAFICDVESGEYIPLAQYDPLVDTAEPFILQESVVGRLVIYFEAAESVAVTMDNIDISLMDLSAQNVYVTGGDYGEILHGYYTYINNMTSSPYADISATRWYVSPAEDGNYEPIGVPNQNYLEFNAGLIGQYVIFEVTPICAETGLVGESVRSVPILVSAPEDIEQDVIVQPAMKPVEIENEKEHPFSDIIGHWAELRISSLRSAGILNGKTPTLFVPEAYVTRAEFTAMTARAFSVISQQYNGVFEDVDKSDWFSGIVEAAYRQGIISGVSDTRFAPNENITREEMAAVIYRAYIGAGGEAPPDFDLVYYDSYLVSPWAVDYVKHTSSLGFFSGTDMNLFEPSRNATRAEAASVIYRVLRWFYK